MQAGQKSIHEHHACVTESSICNNSRPMASPAKKMKNLALERNFKVSLKEMNDYTVKTFNRLDNVAIITSTYGDGDVPEMGADFWEELKNSDVKLPNMKYGLIALGDRSHEHFCGAGKKVSKKLES